MIKAKINKFEYAIKTSWDELTYFDYLHITSISELEGVSYLSGIPVDTIMMIDEDSQNKLSFCLEFIKELPDKKFKCKNIREESFGQKILLQNSLDDKERLPAIALAIYEYDYENLEESISKVLNLSFTEVYCKGINYLEQFKLIAESEALHLKSTPTSEQLRAGLNMFDEFGVMNTVDALANGNILDYDKVLKIDYNTVFIKLKMLKFTGQYKENYSKIMSKKR